jgi:hypothetical protein
MLEPTRGRVRRHAHKAAVVSSILGGLYIAGSYAMEKLRESQEIAADERRARDKSVDPMSFPFSYRVHVARPADSSRT